MYDMERAITIHAANQLLCCFPSKKTMANQTGIPYRVLLRVLQGKSTPKDIERTMSAIARYCRIQRISPEALFQCFVPN